MNPIGNYSIIIDNKYCGNLFIKDLIYKRENFFSYDYYTRLPTHLLNYQTTIDIKFNHCNLLSDNKSICFNLENEYFIFNNCYIINYNNGDGEIIAHSIIYKEINPAPFKVVKKSCKDCAVCKKYLKSPCKICLDH